MRKQLVALLAGVMLMAAGSAGAYTTTIGGVHGNGGWTSAEASAIVETFDGDNGADVYQGWSWTGDYIIVANGASLGGHYSAPAYSNAKESTNYISVPDLYRTGNVSVTDIGGLRNYFGLWWGSMDAYNTLTFFREGATVATITGSDVANGSANGQQYNSDTNNYVNFYFGANELFDSFMMTSTDYAFEADNVAVGTVVPEPGTMMLLGIGMLGMAVFGKRRMNKQA